MMKNSISTTIVILLICLVNAGAIRNSADKNSDSTKFIASQNTGKLSDAIVEETVPRSGKAEQPRSVKSDSAEDKKTDYDAKKDPPTKGTLSNSKTVRLVVPMNGSVKLNVNPSVKYYIGGYSTVYGGRRYRYRGYIVRARIVRYSGYCSFNRTIFVTGSYISVYSSCYWAYLYLVINV